MSRRFTASLVAVLLTLAITMLTATSARADGQVNVTLPDGSTPEKLFTGLTMVPGDTVKETLVVSQTTDQDVMAGLRFESTSPYGPLHDSAEITINGFGSTVSSPLGEALDTDSPFWLGSLSPNSKESVTITVHLPETSGNDTKREQARFRVIVSAQSDLGDDDSAANADNAASADADAVGPDSSSDADAAVAGDADAGVEGDESTGSDGDDSAGGGDDSTGSSDESAATDGDDTTGADGNDSAGAGRASSAGADENGSDSSADGSTGADGSLPRTGLGSLSALIVAGGLLLFGAIALIAVRRRGRHNGRSGRTAS